MYTYTYTRARKEKPIYLQAAAPNSTKNHYSLIARLAQKDYLCCILSIYLFPSDVSQSI